METMIGIAALLVGLGVAWLCFALGVYFFTRTGREGLRIERMEEERRRQSTYAAMEEPPRLSVPPEGIRAGDVWLRPPQLDDVDGLVPAFSDPELRDAGNLPAFSRDELVANLGELPALAETGRLLPLVALDADTSRVIGAGMLHHLDTERRIVEIGYFVLPGARGRGVATTIARMLAEHAAEARRTTRRQDAVLIATRRMT